MEALERALAEIEALEAIYDSAFAISNEDSLRQAREAIECGSGASTTTGEDETSTSSAVEIPRLDVRLDLSAVADADGDSGATQLLPLLCLGLPPGYPESTAAQVSIQQWNGKTRHECDVVTQHLQHRAEALLGQEAVMDLVQELQDLTVSSTATAAQEEEDAETNIPSTSAQISSAAEQHPNGRRWIWVHHIKDTARRKAIIQEARELNLGGFLKYGYPGIVVVEGSQSDCNAFVSWVKGNKSRPGGFGRNWGHHVRGEINNIPTSTNQLPREFVELEEMGELGAACKECGVEDEFLAYVMQHS